MPRFTVRSFDGWQDGEDWLNSLSSNFVLRAMTETNHNITFVVEDETAIQEDPQVVIQAQRRLKWVVVGLMVFMVLMGVYLFVVIRQ